jgi:hypothetical protein
VAAVAGHGVDRGAAAPDDAEQVDVDLAPDLLLLEGPGRPGHQHAGVVDPDGDRPARAGGRRHPAMAVRIPDILHHREGAVAQGGGGLGRGRGVDVGDQYVEAAARELHGDAAPEPAPSSRDDGDWHAPSIAARRRRVKRAKE